MSLAATSAAVGVMLAILSSVAAFVAHARPDAALGVAARLAGQAELLDRGRLSQEAEDHLLAMISGARWPLTGLVFGWSFVGGATLAWWAG